MKTKKQIEDKLDQMMNKSVEIMKVEAKNFHSGYSSALVWALTKPTSLKRKPCKLCDFPGSEKTITKKDNPAYLGIRVCWSCYDKVVLR